MDLLDILIMHIHYMHHMAFDGYVICKMIEFGNQVERFL